MLSGLPIARMASYKGNGLDYQIFGRPTENPVRSCGANGVHGYTTQWDGLANQLRFECQQSAHGRDSSVDYRNSGMSTGFPVVAVIETRKKCSLVPLI